MVLGDFLMVMMIMIIGVLALAMAVPEGRKVWAEDSPNWIVLYERNFITETSLSSTNV